MNVILQIMKLTTGVFRIIAFFSICSPSALHAQADPTGNYPEIGKPIPHFELNNIEHYRATQFAPKDLKGRHVILDFWNKGCVSCVQSFPKLNALHKKYNDKLDIILVGTEEVGIGDMFDRFKEKLQLEFPFAFSYPLYKQFVPQGAPHLVWIYDGNVKAITFGEELNESNVRLFLDNEPFSFTDRSHTALAKLVSSYDPLKPYLVNGNGGNDNDFIYRSLLGNYLPNTPARNLDALAKDPYHNEGRVMVEGVSDLKELYSNAFFGYYQWSYGHPIYDKVYPEAVLEINDSSLFNVDITTGEGFYWYSLIVPGAKANPSALMKYLQEDLKRYFDYDATVEMRKFPYLKSLLTQIG